MNSSTSRERYSTLLPSDLILTTRKELDEATKQLKEAEDLSSRSARMKAIAAVLREKTKQVKNLAI